MSKSRKTQNYYLRQDSNLNKKYKNYKKTYIIGI